MKNEFCLIYTTCPDENTAQSISHTLLVEKLVACTNLFPAVQSQYWWDGQIESSKESVLFLKTATHLKPALERRFLELHPYDAPCFLEIALDSGNPQYLNWLPESLK